MFEELGSEASDDGRSIQSEAHAEFGVTCKANVGPNRHATIEMVNFDTASFVVLVAQVALAAEKAVEGLKAMRLIFTKFFQP